MTTTIALGNCPSSGSTFLADLLDSTPYTAVGPELNLFSIEDLYDKQRLKNLYLSRSRCSSIYIRRNGLVLNDLCAYGLNEARFQKLLENSGGLAEFLEDFAKSFLALRGKSLSGVVFEKSPQNIHCARRYLDNTENYFIHIVRNPVDVFLSLRKRGFSSGIALMTWMLDEAKALDLINNKRFILIKYEDLVENPFSITSGLIRDVSGIEVGEAEVEAGYHDNPYRMYHTTKLASWSQKDFGKIGDRKTKKLSQEDICFLSSLKNLKVSRQYGNLFNIPEVSFMDLLEHFGYKDLFDSAVGSTTGEFRLTSREKYRLFRKFTGDFKYGDAKVSDLNAYLKPVEIV
jgi:hypothetical protein